MKQKRWYCLRWCLLMLLVIGLTIGTGAESGIPTLFHNDEAWYKDSMAPLLVKDGRYHIPADLLGMFEDIDVSYSQGSDNVLVTHADGIYVSILFTDKTAVVQGELQENVGVFRENGYTYVEAEWIADIFDLTCTYAQSEDGKTVLRLSDDSAARTLEELVSLYREETVQETTTKIEKDEPTENVRRIYIVTGDNYENPSFAAAEDVVENSGLSCTLFLHPNSAEEKYWSWGMTGKGGICAADVEEADAVNAKLESLCCRRLEYVLSADADTDRDALRDAGYLVIEPDFVVDYRTDPDAVYAEITEYLTAHDRVIVQVSGDGCSQRMIALLCNLIGSGESVQTEVLF